MAHDDILSRVWGLEATPTNRTVDNFIVQLRMRIECSPDKPEHILTVHGIGHRFV